MVFGSDLLSWDLTFILINLSFLAGDLLASMIAILEKIPFLCLSEDVDMLQLKLLDKLVLLLEDSVGLAVSYKLVVVWLLALVAKFVTIGKSDTWALSTLASSIPESEKRRL